MQNNEILIYSCIRNKRTGDGFISFLNDVDHDQESYKRKSLFVHDNAHSDLAKQSVAHLVSQIAN